MAPLLSATTLVAALDVAVKTAIRLLDRLLAAGIAVEVTRRSKWRLFGLKGMERLADAVRPPCRPEPGRGRSPIIAEADQDNVAGPAVPLPPLTRIDRRAFDYGDLELGMAQLDLVGRRRSLDALARGAPAGAGSVPTDGDGAAADARSGDPDVAISGGPAEFAAQLKPSMRGGFARGLGHPYRNSGTARQPHR